MPPDFTQRKSPQKIVLFAEPEERMEQSRKEQSRKKM